jgi:hypothetical protein
MEEKLLLGIDSLINLALGLILLIFPIRLIEALGVPVPDNNFYANILGAVLFGIGLALLLEFFRSESVITGLGIGGAIAINICGAGVLMLWLIFGELDIPVRGYVTLWCLAILVLGISLFEFVMALKRKGARQ